MGVGYCGVCFLKNIQTPKIFSGSFRGQLLPTGLYGRERKNRTPDKLPASEKKPLEEVCDQHLKEIVEILKPEWLVGVGGFARKRAEEALEEGS